MQICVSSFYSPSLGYKGWCRHLWWTGNTRPSSNVFISVRVIL